MEENTQICKNEKVRKQTLKKDRQRNRIQKDRMKIVSTHVWHRDGDKPLRSIQGLKNGS